MLAADEVAVAVDIGGTTMRTGVFGSHYHPGDTIAELTKSPSAALEPDPVPVLVSMLRNAIPSGKRLGGAVLGLPVMFDRDTRIPVSSPNLPGFVGCPVGQRMSDTLGVPVLVDRDTVLMATGEWIAGAAVGSPALLAVYIGTGVGATMLFDGKPYRGTSGGAVEIGHIPIRNAGTCCICGNTDCLEAYASGHVLNAVARDAAIPVERIFTSPETARAVADYADALGQALACAVNMFDPDTLLIGGGLARRPGFPLERVVTTARAHMRAPAPRNFVRIVPAAFGSRAIIPGAYHLLSNHRKASPC